jgi:hypothetical protein
MVYKYVPLFVFSLFLFADCVAQSWTSILVIRSSLNFIQVDLYCNCGEVLITSRDILTSIALFQRVRGDSQGVEGLMHLHAYIPIAVSQAHTLRTWHALRMGYLMFTSQREARSLAAVPGPQIVQKAEGQRLKLVLSEQEYPFVVRMSQVIGHVSIALMQKPPQLCLHCLQLPSSFQHLML